jgi:hypothetical protein
MTRNRNRNTIPELPVGTKNRDAWHSSSPNNHYLESGLVTGYGGAVGETSSITDVVGNRNGRNDVGHIARIVNAPASNMHFEFLTSNGWSYKADWEISVIAALDWYTGPVSSPVNYATLAKARIKPLGKEQIAGFVDIAELDQQLSLLANYHVRMLARLLWESYSVRLSGKNSSLNSLGKSRYNGDRWIKFFKTVKDDLYENNKTPMAFIQTLINTDLGWKFGWKPFITDCQQALKCVNAMDSLLNRIKVPYKVFGQASDSLNANITGNFVTGPDFSYTRLSAACAKTTNIRAVAEVEYQLKPGADVEGIALRVAALRDMLGLKLSAKSAWAVLPYSFVVDWFYTVSTFLSQFEGQPFMNGYMDIISKGISLKTETSISAVFSHPHSSDLIKGEASEKTYTRVYGDNSLWGLTPPVYPAFKLPNLGQWWTGVELVVQNLFGSHKSY